MAMGDKEKVKMAQEEVKKMKKNIKCFC